MLALWTGTETLDGQHEQYEEQAGAQFSQQGLLPVLLSSFVVVNISFVSLLFPGSSIRRGGSSKVMPGETPRENWARRSAA